MRIRACMDSYTPYPICVVVHVSSASGPLCAGARDSRRGAGCQGARGQKETPDCGPGSPEGADQAPLRRFGRILPSEDRPRSFERVLPDHRLARYPNRFRHPVGKDGLPGSGYQEHPGCSSGGLIHESPGRLPLHPDLELLSPLSPGPPSINGIVIPPVEPGWRLAGLSGGDCTGWRAGVSTGSRETTKPPLCASGKFEERGP